MMDTKQLQWISTVDRLPKYEYEVMVIVSILDILGSHIEQRLIASGQFDGRSGWSVRNGYLPSSRNPKGFEMYRRVLFWKDFDEETLTLFNEKGGN